MVSEESRKKFGEYYESAMESKARGRTIARFIGGSIFALSGLGISLAVVTHEKDPKPYLVEAGILAGGTLITTVGPRVIDRIYDRIQDLALEVVFREDTDEADEDKEDGNDQ